MRMMSARTSRGRTLVAPGPTLLAALARFAGLAALLWHAGCGDARLPADDGGVVSPRCTAVASCTASVCDEATLAGGLVDGSGSGFVQAAPPTVTPPAPLIMRSVRLGGDTPGTFLSPVATAWRSSSDGRVVIVNGRAGSSLQVARLELLETGPVALQPAELATNLFSTTGPAWPPADGDPAQGGFLCSPVTTNPSVCTDATGDDCYDLVLVLRNQGQTGQGMPFTTLTGYPIRVHVSAPKTTSATVRSFEFTAASTTSPRMGFRSSGEMVPTADGRLVTLRIHNGDDTSAGAQISYHLSDHIETNTVSLAYAFSETPCDVTRWAAQSAGAFDSIRPWPAAPYDQRLVPHGYGIAARPLRDSNGVAMPETAILAGSYPWLDRAGNNLLFSTVDPAIASADASQTRFPIRREQGPLKAIVSAPRGFAIVGGWTQGKTVMIDGRLNNEDFGFDPSDTHQLVLYRSPMGPLAVRTNGGSNNGVNPLELVNANGNNHEIESIENNASMHVGSVAVTPRDVVWSITRGLATDEVAFDDFMNPNLILFAEMTAAWEATGSPKDGLLDDGFAASGSGANAPFTHDSSAIRIQNSAASALVPLAATGRIEGEARIEPVALGGIHGRGLWLEPTAAATFQLPDALAAVAASSGFELGLFIDAREGLGGEHALWSFMPTSGEPVIVRLVDGELVEVEHGTEHVRIDLSCQVESWVRRWHHLAFLFEPSGHLTLFVDGNPVGGAQLATPFALGGGVLRVGGIRGWYDDVRLELDGPGHPLTQAASVELACNNARGTMVAVASSSPSYARALLVDSSRAAAVGAAAPGAGSLLWCATEYTADLAVGRGVLPPGTTAMRDAILQENAPPLTWDQPRPDSTKRSFCRSCHVDATADPGRIAGLTLQALLPGTLSAANDPRTQPSQPPSFGDEPAWARGSIPAGWITAPGGSSQPPTSAVGPLLILPWLLPSSGH
ncbi:hypothetical protein BH11MYX1_BH11MYX1_17210 [soil metagenome]